MAHLNFAVCVMCGDYDHEKERTTYTVAQVLQLFETEEVANEAMHTFNPFYNYDVEVIPVINLPDYQ